MTIRTCLTALIVFGAAMGFAPTAFADEEPQGNDIRDKIKAQMEKILELMKANEEALIELSTGNQAETRKVDVKVDSPENDAGSSSGSSSSGSKKDGASKGDDVRKGLDELLKAHSGSKAIPSELEELVRMIPT